MPYNLSRTSFEAYEPMLTPLIQGEPRVIRVEEGDPHRLAFLLRQAMAAARENSIEPFASMEVKFSVGPGRVICLPKTVPSLSDQEILEEAQTQVVLDAVNAFDVVNAATGSIAPRLEFPNFEGSHMPLKTWAERKGFEITSTDPLTLERTT